MISITRFTERHVGPALAIETLVFPKDGSWSEGAFCDALENPNLNVVAAKSTANDLIGYIVFGTMRVKRRWRCVIVNLAVDPSCWRRGVGSTLVDFAVRNSQFHRTSAVVFIPDKPYLIDFFTKCGFNKRKRDPDIPTIEMLRPTNAPVPLIKY